MRRRRRSAAEWTRLVAECQASGLSSKRFAEGKGIPPTTFAWWVSRLRRRGRGAAALVPVHVVDAPSAAAEGFRLELASGRTLVVPMSFAPEALRRLLGVLEGGC